MKELSIDVKNYALSSYATAQAVLTRHQKQVGAVVINLGGGVTDYIAYQRGAVVHTGVLGVGGDHLTNDIVSGLKIPYAKAELLKKTEGSVILDPADGDGEPSRCPAPIISRSGNIYRASLNTIMQARQAEIFEIILDDLQAAPFLARFRGHDLPHRRRLAGEGTGRARLADLPVPGRARAPVALRRRPELRAPARPEHPARPAALRAAGGTGVPASRGLARVGQSLKRALASMRVI